MTTERMDDPKDGFVEVWDACLTADIQTIVDGDLAYTVIRESWNAGCTVRFIHEVRVLS